MTIRLTTDDRRPISSTMTTRLTFLLVLLATACTSSVEPLVRVGSIQIPLASLESLQEPEQQMFLDLLGFGQSVAGGELAVVGEPYIERELMRSRIENLPLHLGARRSAVDDGTLRDAYAVNPEWELVVRHVVRLADREAPGALRDSARSVAGVVADRAARGEDFAALAAAYSEEPGAAERGGLLQPGRRGSWVDEFWMAALALRPGQVSPVIESPYGFHVLKLEERRPVPFEEADRTEMLRWFVPAQVADAAMAEWAASDGGLRLDPGMVPEAFDSLRAGVRVPENRPLASSQSGLHHYTGRDLAAGWRLMTPEERLLLERATPEALVEWLQNDAREVLWGKQAEDLGVPVGAIAVDDASHYWEALAAAFARAFGFTAGMSSEQVITAATQALLSGAPEARSARAELRSLRPRLRQLYPVVESTPAS